MLLDIYKLYTGDLVFQIQRTYIQKPDASNVWFFYVTDNDFFRFSLSKKHFVSDLSIATTGVVLFHNKFNARTIRICT